MRKTDALAAALAGAVIALMATYISQATRLGVTRQQHVGDEMVDTVILLFSVLLILGVIIGLMWVWMN